MRERERESPPRRNRYSPAPPQGHFPSELMTQAPMGMASWDDVRVRYEYYKGRGYLRDLDLNDYIKWEDWWYKYQAWLKQVGFPLISLIFPKLTDFSLIFIYFPLNFLSQERYWEAWERSQINRRRRIQKKIPITQRLN